MQNVAGKLDAWCKYVLAFLFIALSEAQGNIKKLLMLKQECTAGALHLPAAEADPMGFNLLPQTGLPLPKLHGLRTPSLPPLLPEILMACPLQGGRTVHERGSEESFR